MVHDFVMLIWKWKG